jgi:hypothetical protein
MKVEIELNWIGSKKGSEWLFVKRVRNIKIR